MEISNSYELFLALKKFNLLKDSPWYWWPNAHTFEVVVGALLTQNTRWENVQKSLNQLRANRILRDHDDQSLQNLAKSSKDFVASLIIPSGFYHQKSLRLILLAQNILQDFGDFESFVAHVDRTWLLEQKGIGFESADCILNYACKFPIMVVDQYTRRLVAKIGFEFEDYESLQAWCMDGIRDHWDKLQEYKSEDEVFARFHGKIVEWSKKKIGVL